MFGPIVYAKLEQGHLPLFSSKISLNVPFKQLFNFGHILAKLMNFSQFYLCQ